MTRLGAGSGFSSEMLARFGYRVVAVDPDLRALQNNRARPRFDRSRIEGAVTVAWAIAQSLPFAKDTFDGVLAMKRAKTSRYPGVLRATITVHELPRELVRNHTRVGLVELANISDSVWLSEPDGFGGFVTLGCKLLQADGRLVDDAIGRTMLPRDIHPARAFRWPCRLPWLTVLMQDRTSCEWTW
jgi:SAM-dependent methyltransferase